MKRLHTHRWAALVLLLPGVLIGAEPPAEPDDPGARIAAGGLGAKVPACSSCHGARGEGNAEQRVPRLAAQPAYYLEKQLADYASGSRINPIMRPIAQALAPAQRQALAVYYAGLSAPAGHAKGSEEAASRGRALAEVGDERRGIQACVNCHGPQGSGRAPGFPYLAGQHGSYLVAALRSWKTKSRRNDPSQQMPLIATQLSPEEANDLAAYFERLTAPAPPR